jgi:hypothetical protein
MREETVILRGSPVTVAAADDVFRVLGERGGDLYLWLRRHGCCVGALVMLEADTSPPPSGEHVFERAQGHGFDLFIDLGTWPPPRTLALELRGRTRKFVAYWNGMAYVA